MEHINFDLEKAFLDTILPDAAFFAEANRVSGWIAEHAEEFVHTFKGSNALRRLINAAGGEEVTRAMFTETDCLSNEPTEPEVIEWFDTLTAGQRESIYWMIMNGQVSIADTDDVAVLAWFNNLTEY